MTPNRTKRSNVDSLPACLPASLRQTPICSELTRKLFVFATFATTVQKKKEQKLKLLLEQKRNYPTPAKLEFSHDLNFRLDI